MTREDWGIAVLAVVLGSLAGTAAGMLIHWWLS